ncbi:tetraspanin-18 [Sabethes cyaneus]|uniref:tetraspanin-18 n=1 Tax=Sabethes cyaneus TaxID=53552 RepID=UPI00221E2B7D|nr:tetraspanin-18 [Sabethes cyaneus]XP_053689866.1 tetraspanin-18 [Sabethes cyaneus]XP_053689867.1 tetraspanin-18 [Sabethes cyaneus]XP_053689868.1 tetraspanin-18 [Sabethes cyaneus]XP_053689869.1 tetraspanin-18 [Sabethes cyaneus]
MGCDCESCIAKSLLSLFNFVFFVLGSIVLGVGIWLAADKSSFIALLKMVETDQLEHFTQPAVIEQLAYLLIVIGAVMFFLSFLGYCGALRESQCLLTTYGLFLLVILILEVTACGLAVAYKDRAKTETKNYLQTTISKYYSSNDRNQSDAVTLMWNYLMSEMHCCGVEDYRDFSLSDKWNESKGNRVVPEACCIQSALFEPQDKNCPVSPSDSNSYYKQGCYNALIDWIMYNRNLVIIVAIGVGLVQLVAIFLAFCLCKSIEKYRGMRL